MAENKYDLLLVNTLTNKKVRPQTWYKERVIKTKYIKSLKPGDTSKMLVGKNWTFIKDGLDDFRDGLPPDISNGIMLKGEKGPSPNIQGGSDVSSVKEPVQRGRFNRYDICYSRVTPQTLRRRENIEEIEYGLTQHPLALYPHLEECMPPDVFEDVVDILDPEMNLADDDASNLEDDLSTEKSDSNPPSRANQIRSRNINENELESEKDADDPFAVKNPYRWLPRKEEKDEKKDKKKAAEKRSGSPSQDEHIKHVTKDFCDWVADLGGESNNIEESTIHSLFASGYETKPALSVPIHVVELTNVPPELRKTALPGAVAQAPPKDTEKSFPTPQEEKQDWMHSNNYVPSWVKPKYGAWYLPPKTWKPRAPSEPLQDPKELKDQDMSESKAKSDELNEQLAPMHCAKSFMDYVDNKGQRRPEFLNRVSDFQKKVEAEEKAKQDAEAAKVRRRSVSAPKPVLAES